jgi:putative DNA primase/helicase
MTGDGGRDRILEGVDTAISRRARDAQHLKIVDPSDISAVVSPFALLAELDAARLFAERYDDRIRYCPGAGGWLVWDGQRWRRDDDGAIFRLIGAFTDLIAELASGISNLDERRRVLSFAIALRRRRGVESIAVLASALDGVAIGDPQCFDADPYLLNVANGTIDLRTGELRGHNREDLITKVVSIRYEPEALCPRWLQFLEEMFGGDRATIDFLQRALGYSLTGLAKEHVFFVLHGTGANGKSTLLALTAKILGDYGVSCSSETFVDRRSGAATNDLARLRGARFVSAIETSENRALAESFVKAVTGGDRITARFLYREFFDFEPTFKLWLGTNHKPIIKGGDQGIWRRVRLIPFEQRFEGDRRDPDLREKLDGELPGILAWTVRGALAWQRGQLEPSPSVTRATAAYRSEMDTFSDFIDERCVFDPAASVPARELYGAFREWCEVNGESPQSQKWFGLRLADHGFRSDRKNRVRLWAGLRLG